MMGAAPVAASMPINDVPTALPHGQAALLGVQAVMRDPDPSPVVWAQRRLKAAQWAKENGLDETVWPPPLLTIENNVEAMRSWSKAHKTIAIRERYIKRSHDNAIEQAMRGVKREIMLATLPDWMRRFLSP